MPDQGSIAHSIENHISTIEFYHPKGNSLPGKLLRELSEAVKEASESDKSRVIVIKSKGDGAFCAGASFDELLAIENFDQGKEFFMGFANVLNAMRKSPKFIIVRVQGKVVGGGLGLVSAADYALAHSSASVKLSELALGIGPFVVGPAVGRKIGVGAFQALSIDAKKWHSSEWAKSKALYSQVFDSVEEMDEELERLASELAASNPDAMEELRDIQWQKTGHWDATLEQRAEISGRLVLSDFTRKFIQKFKKTKSDA